MGAALSSTAVVGVSALDFSLWTANLATGVNGCWSACPGDAVSACTPPLARRSMGSGIICRFVFESQNYCKGLR